jgi:hypothetical protein
MLTVTAAMSVAGAVVFAAGAGAAPKETARPSAIHQLNHRVAPVRDAKPGGGARPSSNGIDYHGGPVLMTTAHAYVIWYGTWSSSAKQVLSTLLGGIGGSPYYKINTTYHDGAGRIVPNSVTLAGQTDDSYSQGKTNLSDGQIATIVSSAIAGGRLPKDTGGVYFVFTSADVTKSGFLTSYCGWHDHGTMSGSDIKYAFVGDPGANASCSMQTSVSPNGLPGPDAMASVIAHELEEAATDPDLNAWYDRRGYENADKCAWTFGTTYTTANGSKANMKLGGLDFLIQRNWVNASGGYCALSY